MSQVSASSRKLFRIRSNPFRRNSVERSVFRLLFVDGPVKDFDAAIELTMRCIELCKRDRESCLSTMADFIAIVKSEQDRMLLHAPEFRGVWTPKYFEHQVYVEMFSFLVGESASCMQGKVRSL